MPKISRMLCCVLVLSGLTLAGCNSTQSTFNVDKSVAINPVFNLKPVESENEIFRLDSKIKSQLTEFFKNGTPQLMQTQALMQFLIDNGESSLAYQSNANLTATQAYYNLNANCLSLSILAYSLAEHLGFKGQFQRVHIPEYWDQSQGYSLLTGHVNLVVSETNRNVDNSHILYTRPNSIVIDFDPNSRRQAFSTSKISKKRILSMFYSNKGAMAIVDGDYDTAYSYFRAAVTADPDHSGAWGNLGIVYRLAGFHQQAEQAYQQALALNPDNNNVLGNLAILYKLTDREHEGDSILARLDEKRRNNPYYLIVKGNEAINDNQYEQALSYFRKAKKLDSKLHDSYFGMAKVYYLRDDLERAKLYLNKAYQLSEFEHDRHRYQGKLQWLQAVAKN
ncbi:tetratricopeptide repeat protein [Pseudoalteromonas sp. S16_S37]|uniref:tetratricopeptide repeat protein n=1 Tax=Pseudoalteromonas sp. S16_S37 TaxID=2720228 RepID=UPI001680CFD9|nr:tetratricopeptide repeat protein [Pseudoalteromonas sp. S16_S37]MBD1583619.1 tetratricopeptide repeat protein [Pseudoalteromonas sp. S16_S37]